MSYRFSDDTLLNSPNKQAGMNDAFKNCSYQSAFGSLSSHAHDWFLSPLALNETGTSHTTWRYSDQIAVIPVESTSGRVLDLR